MPLPTWLNVTNLVALSQKVWAYLEVQRTVSLGAPLSWVRQGWPHRNTPSPHRLTCQIWLLLVKRYEYIHQKTGPFGSRLTRWCIENGIARSGTDNFILVIHIRCGRVSYVSEKCHNKLCGRPPQYSLAPFTGSAQRQPWARPAHPGPMSQYTSSQPAGRLVAHAARQPDALDRRRQTRRQTASSLNAPA